MHKTMLAAIGIMLIWSGAVVADDAQKAFLQNLKEICGHSYLGSVVESNEGDTAWRQAKIVIHTPSCEQDMSDEIRIPLYVGEDKSRTWIISKTENGLRLKHDHRHADGTADAVSMYGGDTMDSGSKTQQSFPVDDFSKTLFVENGLDDSVNNTWTISVVPNDRLSYRLSRPGRLFQVDFDLSKSLN